MALLTKATRKKWFKVLGLGDYNKANILKMQRMYFKNPKDCDGIYGKDTDRLLRHLHHTKAYTTSFAPFEFACPCGRCTGYPTWMRAKELKHIQKIRNHYGVPMKITSGLRCPSYNARVGGVDNSAHLSGYAVDFYMKGVTDTLEERRSAINYIRKLVNHDFSYCNGYNSYGRKVSAPQMGNAIHTQTK